MKRALRWFIGILLVLLALIVVAFFSINPVARSVAEKRLREETGMEAHIGKFEIGFRDGTVRVENLRLINPPEFGGSTFISLPEVFLQVDSEALRSNKLHLLKVRLDLAEMHLVEKQDGRKNTDVFQKTGESSGGNGTNAPSDKVEFAGIDHLEISLGKVKYTSERYPNRNYERNLGVKNRTFENIETEKDLKTVGVLLVAQVGFGALLEGVLTSPKDILKKGSAAGEEAREVIEDLTDPLQKQAE